MCSYSTDFFNAGGFDLKIKDWGNEDGDLYRKYEKSGYKILRAADPDIFHVWHDKFCDSSLPKNTYSACMSARQMNEAPSDG